MLQVICTINEFFSTSMHCMNDMFLTSEGPKMTIVEALGMDMLLVHSYAINDGTTAVRL